MQKDEVGPLLLQHTQKLIQNGLKTKHRATSKTLRKKHIEQAL